ncbi:VCBS repeat-containing protein [Streptomyces sp. B93]|uniref:FG-GAP repeat domain-containing protein n=1 Tax=Streptomyces sp. B93 TaxID=2824875 RepID=UPI001B38074E|nr:VCBS repeat-containing protein [Streptomyces sp. B93]
MVRGVRAGGLVVATAVRRAGGLVVATAVGCLLLTTGCGSPPDDTKAEPSRPVQKAAQAPASPQLPVPRGKGSDIPDDFNGDGHRDLILNDLVKAQSHADDAGIGVVYGGTRGLTPGARQLLTPERHAARTQDQLPALFDAEAGCDLDGDGFTDLVVSTDPPYDGQGRPPVPLQLLFGSPEGLTGKAVKLTVPDRARAGNDWPDQPVCGDFDGDGAQDLVLHASEQQLSYLRGPFTRKGAPRTAAAPLPAPGNLPTGPATDVNQDGYDDLLVRTAEDTGPATLVLGTATGPTGTGITLPSGTSVALGRFGGSAALDAAVATDTGETSLRYDLPTATPAALPDTAGTGLTTADFDGDGYDDLVSGSDTGLRVVPGAKAGPAASAAVTLTPAARGTSRVLTAGDFDGDGRADLVVRTYRGETADTIALYPGTKGSVIAGSPVLTFSSAEFLPG